MTQFSRLFAVVVLTLLVMSGCEPAPAPSPPGRPAHRQAPWSPSSPPKPQEPPAAAAVAPPARRPQPGPPVDAVNAEPLVRVRIATAQPRLVVNSTSPVTVRSGQDPAVQPVAFRPPLHIHHAGDQFYLRDAGGQLMQWRLPSLRIDPAAGASLNLGDTPYPGSLVIHPAENSQVDAVNYVPMEQYLPGVLTRELYGSWEPAAFEAQAIAARSYAIWESSLAPHRHFDLESTTASQAYGGHTASPKALAAVARTRGRVLTYEDRVLPAFYCSAVGPVGQDASIVFGDRVPDLAPLRGGPRGHDAGTPSYSWGPVAHPTAQLAQRIAAWGTRNAHPVARLQGLASIQPVPGPHGRPAAFILTDARTQTFNLGPEQLRFAANYTGPGAPPLPANQKLKSSYVSVTTTPTVTAFRGYGFGHGVGLSQWAAQVLARQGHSPEAILATYYPGATLRRLY